MYMDILDTARSCFGLKWLFEACGVPRKEIIKSRVDFGELPFGVMYITPASDRYVHAEEMTYDYERTHGLVGGSLFFTNEIPHGIGIALRSASGDHDWRLGYCQRRHGVVLVDAKKQEGWRMQSTNCAYGARPIVTEGNLGWVAAKCGLDTDPPKFFANAVNQRAAWYQSVYNALPAITVRELYAFLDDIAPQWRALAVIQGRWDEEYSFQKRWDSHVPIPSDPEEVPEGTKWVPSDARTRESLRTY